MGDGSNDTTAKHNSHLYDANCRICARKSLDDQARQQRYERILKKEQVGRERVPDSLQEEKEQREKKSTQRKANGLSPHSSSKLNDSPSEFDDLPPGVDDLDDDPLDSRFPPVKAGNLHSGSFGSNPAKMTPRAVGPDHHLSPERVERRESWRKPPPNPAKA